MKSLSFRLSLCLSLSLSAQVAMELHSLQLPTATSIPSGSWKDKLLLSHSNKLVKFPDYYNRCSDYNSRKLKFISLRSQSSGTAKFSSLAVEATLADSKTKENNLIYVAGATGKVGSRTVRELLKLGFNVRAGVRSAQRAESLVQSVEQMEPDIGISSEGPKPIEKLEIVECDLEKPEQIKPALGNASIIICCIGASEKEIFDITGPYRIDYQATKNLIDAATAAKVNHFILLTSLGTNKVGFPAAILNLFWGVLIWKRKAEEALLASGLPYTIVRPGGMERPTDAYKETHNITLSEEDTLFGGQVSNLQVAELMAYMAKNRSLSYCKVVEVIAETTSPLTPLGDLLAKIPSQQTEAKPLKKPDAADKPQPAASTSTISEPPALSPSLEDTKEKKRAPRPLSPYTMYEDLKPPSSLSTTPGGPEEVTLKVVSEITGGNGVANVKSSSTEQDPPLVFNYSLSPYIAYEDLKPPTSPSPAPTK